MDIALENKKAHLTEAIVDKAMPLKTLLLVDLQALEPALKWGIGHPQPKAPRS
jgi:hypothetical protein